MENRYHDNIRGNSQNAHAQAEVTIVNEVALAIFHRIDDYIEFMGDITNFNIFFFRHKRVLVLGWPYGRSRKATESFVPIYTIHAF